MKSSIHRTRLKNAIVFFAEHTEACGKIKLFKLLYMFDFEHFRQTGKSATGLHYEAWKLGPVPVELNKQWHELKSGRSDSIEIVPEKQVDHTRETVKLRPGVTFDDGDFTPRQIRILQSLCDKYLDVRSQKIIDVTHEQNGAWDKIWAGGKGNFSTIPYELAIPDDAPNRDLILESSLEFRHISPPVEEGAY
jgi:uncharacterized phage-associated protein